MEPYFGNPKVNAIPGANCCGKPVGCTNQNPGCVYLSHPYKRWVRGEITLDELRARVCGPETTNEGAT